MAITTYWKIQTPDSTTPISTSAWTNLANSIENALPNAGQPVVISAFPGDGNLIGSNATNLYLSTITGVFFYAGY